MMILHVILFLMLNVNKIEKDHDFLFLKNFVHARCTRPVCQNIFSIRNPRATPWWVWNRQLTVYHWTTSDSPPKHCSYSGNNFTLFYIYNSYLHERDICLFFYRFYQNLNLFYTEMRRRESQLTWSACWMFV